MTGKFGRSHQTLLLETVSNYTYCPLLVVYTTVLLIYPAIKWQEATFLEKEVWGEFITPVELANIASGPILGWDGRRTIQLTQHWALLNKAMKWGVES
ncbi:MULTISPECIES: hypothetical protein [unclassified Leptolyngbya]|uniref:hypothetical protein n=1 Tax=unclassified Leptolyngbya TaxID=2650499 RepID=UPI0016853D3C|nr:MULTISPECIES: hypothetical protein [unclassified Leptolyngbya]MBD1911404.1 hypothetical protein [Leptolyngbya sp. FACHB-8]MBD2159030.1 hypothetical protein [Leptolyngbya sp. FACHB-16]